MPFFQKSNYYQGSILIKQIRSKHSLWANMSKILQNITSKNKLYSIKTYTHTFEKRVSSFISSKILHGSMTIEAALVLPIFLFSIFSLISLISVIKIKSCMDIAVCEVGNEIAIKKYSEYSGDIFLPAYIKNELGIFLEDNLSEQDRKRLYSKIYVTDISLLEEEEIVTFRVDYSVIPDFHMLGLCRIKMNTTYYGHSWQGSTSTKQEETMVFISQNASVYHTDKNCTHFNLTIEKILYDNVNNFRNNEGEKYDECRFCNRIANKGKVYITPEGENYHNIKNCAGLTRSVYTIPYSKVFGKQKCLRCGEKE